MTLTQSGIKGIAQAVAQKVQGKDGEDVKKDLTAEIKDLVIEFRTDYGVVQALNGLELEIERGKTLGLVGETGAGKTTTGLSLLRLIPNPPGVIVSGSIKLDGKDILSMSEKEMQDIRGKTVAMIFQDPMTSLDPVMTVEQQIAEVIKLHEEGGQAEALKRAREMLELVGIPGSRGGEYPHQFSGGMILMVFLALAEVESGDEHLKVEILFSVFPKLSFSMTMVGKLLTLVYSGIILYSGCLMLPSVQRTLAKASKFPIRYLYYAMLLGILFWMIQTVINMVKMVKERGAQK